MLDVARTLDPANGLVRGWRIDGSADAGELLWRVSAELAGGAGRDDDPLRFVGAQGVSRGDTLVRAAGEAVERYALAPRPGRGPAECTCRAADLGGDGLDFAGARLGDSAAIDQVLTWYEGTWLDTGAPVWVPAGLVDHPAADRWFDSGPSGAASGPSLEFATRAALLELVERDAAMVAWAGDRPWRLIDADAALRSGDRTDRNWRQLERLLANARAHRLTPAFVDVPTLSGHPCILACIVDGDRLAAVGVKAHPELGRALLIALQESLQVRHALAGFRAEPGQCAPPAIVRNDFDRARLWMSEQGVAELRHRLDSSTMPAPDTTHALGTRSALNSTLAPDTTHALGTRSALNSTLAPDTTPARGTTPASGTTTPGPLAPATDVRELVAALANWAVRPIVVDLTSRLPDTQRDMGWRAVKVVAPGLQPLRMDESKRFTWVTERLERSGVRRPCGFPHPLI